MSFIFISSPYSDPNPDICEHRYRQVGWYFCSLLGQRRHAFSPILHNHRIAQEYDLKTDAASWAAYNFAMLSAADELHILMLDGWQQSVGVTYETSYWRGAKPNSTLRFVEWNPQT